jgi:superkiller protein 3
MTRFVKKNGTKGQYKKALQVHLPTSPLYSSLEGRVNHPALTYLRLVEMTEEEEKETIAKRVNERRTRIGAKRAQVEMEVKREVYKTSRLPEFYQGIIDWTRDDTQRREYEEKLFQRAYDHLLVVGKDNKSGLGDHVIKMAHGMVLIKHRYELAWNVTLEWKDVESLDELDPTLLRDYISLYPDTGLSTVLQAHLGSAIRALPLINLDDSDDDEEEGGVQLLTSEERLLMMQDGIIEAKHSPLAHRVVSEFFLRLEEYESAVEVIRAGIWLISSESKKSGLRLLKNLDGMNTLLGTALIKYQTPRNHPEAKALFEDILRRKQNFTPALLGVGLVLEEEQNYVGALEYLEKARKRDPTNVRVGLEAAWCRALTGHAEQGLKELEHYLEQLEPVDQASRELRAETLYRIGRCQWDLDASRSSRKDRKGPYSKFLAAVKANINFAPAYTSLGIYYEDYGRDKKRARSCFQKAFDLSASEVVAAERLARSFADQRDWEVVEIIAQRVVDSGKARPPPGSGQKGISWPYSALGVVQMNRQEYQKAIVSFLAALRIRPDDYNSYVGLGESYHNSGRYNSALRTFTYAENPEDGVKMKKSDEDWFTKYMLANVSRELGSFDEAINAYRAVLEGREDEFGVEIALMQTLVEHGWRSIESGFFGRATECASQSLDVALGLARQKPEAFNLWKGVADACSIFSWVQDRGSDIPTKKILQLLEHEFDVAIFDEFSDVDGVGQDVLTVVRNSDESGDTDPLSIAVWCAILAQKRALHHSTSDIHAQAVAWYNLGWSEYRAYTCLEERSIQDRKSSPYLKAAMRCFKRAIELEAGNAEFWNSLGVATTNLNPRVAQHAFVRSLHLNERNPKAWTNLGTLYMLQKDYDLAHAAFSRGQSTDPDHAHAWVGEGIVALLCGKAKEALLHFTHAFEISESSTTVIKKEFAAQAFDSIVKRPDAKDTESIQPLFALQQLHALNSKDVVFDHITALFQERIGSPLSAITTLTSVCETLEAKYEETESSDILTQFVQAKSDLARNHLSAGNFGDAVGEAETTLDLLPDASDPAVAAETRHKILLSSRLTLGLAHYYLGQTDASLAAFRAALEETDASPDVICSLAAVLWAKGGADERAVAREQLLECVGRGDGHVGATLLLGVMTAVQGDDDEEGIAAVVDELQAFRTRDLDPVQAAQLNRVLAALTELSGPDEQEQGREREQEWGRALAVRAEIQRSIFLAPWSSDAWTRLAELEDYAPAARTALRHARRTVPPRGKLGAGMLAQAFAGAGTVADSQRAIMVAPWSAVGWAALADQVRGVRG